MKNLTNLPTAVAATLTLGALLWPKLAVFSFLAAVIALAARSDRVQARHRRVHDVIRGLTLVGSVLALTRFIVQEAVPGISEARGRDSEQKAVSRLRELLFAEDSMRRLAPIDPDHDGVGSAGFLSELSGAQAARGNIALPHPPLAARLSPRTSTSTGPALLEGSYLFLICLPRLGGGFTGVPSDAVDEERAEREWFAFAWPERAGGGAVFAIDQDERILKGREPNGAPQGSAAESSKFEPHESQGIDAWFGANAPPCALEVLRDTAVFQPWRGKKPRETLPHSGEARATEHH